MLSLEGEYFPNSYFRVFHDLNHKDLVAFLKNLLLLGFVLTVVNNSRGLSHSYQIFLITLDVP